MRFESARVRAGVAQGVYPCGLEDIEGDERIRTAATFRSDSGGLQGIRVRPGVARPVTPLCNTLSRPGGQP